MAATKYRIETYTSATAKGDKFFWRLKRSGKVIAPSEGYGRARDRDATVAELAKALKAPVKAIKLPAPVPAAPTDTSKDAQAAAAPAASDAPDARPQPIPGVDNPALKDVG